MKKEKENGCETNRMFSERLQLIRKQKKISQYEIANILGVSQPTISAYEQELSVPSVNNLTLLCKFLNVSADYLLGLSDAVGFVDKDKEEILNKYEKLLPDEKKVFQEWLTVFSKNSTDHD